MIVDGKEISLNIRNNLKAEIASFPEKLKLVIVRVGSDIVQEKFVKQKIKVAEELSIFIDDRLLPPDISQEDIEKEVKKIVDDKEVSGIIIQLPLPGRIDKKRVLDLVPPKKDPDLMSELSKKMFSEGQSKILPPIVGAIEEIFARNQVSLENKKVAVLGEGELVGKPVVVWLKNKNIDPIVISKENGEPLINIEQADIIISGAGSPHLIKADMIKRGVVLIDAGTSEINGVIAGDAEPSCIDKAGLITTVPGGVGPIVVARLFKNLVDLYT